MGQIPPSVDSNPAPGEGGVLTEHRKKFKHRPELDIKGKFVREGIMLHRQSIVSSQSQRMRETMRGTERDHECSGNLVYTLLLISMNCRVKTLFTYFPLIVWVCSMKGIGMWC